jgi:hypothetical protein
MPPNTFTPNAKANAMLYSFLFDCAEYDPRELAELPYTESDADLANRFSCGHYGTQPGDECPNCGRPC